MKRSPAAGGRHRASFSQALFERWLDALQRGFARQQAAAVDSLLRLLAEPLATVLTWLVMGCAIALPLALFLLASNLGTLASSLERDNTVSLYLHPDLNSQEIDMLVDSLARRPEVAGLTLIDADEALAEFRANSGFGDVLDGLEENPLPPVLLVQPAGETAEEAGLLHAFLAGLPEVELAQIDLQWLQRLDALLAVALRLVALLGALLALGLVLVIGNTVRMAIAERRAEIVVVKLVGATDAWVARPFLYTGLWYGVGGALVALLFTALGLWLLDAPVQRLLTSYDSSFRLQGLGLTGGFWVVLGTALLGLVGAWISVLRHLRHIEPR